MTQINLDDFISTLRIKYHSPAIATSSPRWIIDQKAQLEIENLYFECVDKVGEIRTADIIDQYPMPGSIAMQIDLKGYRVNVLATQKGSDDFDRVIITDKSVVRMIDHKSASHWRHVISSADPDHQDAVSRLIRAVVGHLTLKEGDQSEQYSITWGEIALDMCRLVYAFRQMFADRYEVRPVRHSIHYPAKPQDRHLLSIRWTAPTPRYVDVERHRSNNSPVNHRGPVCQYMVQEHERHYKSGKVAVIPAHPRGNPNIARKTTIRLAPARRRVTMEELLK